MLLKRLLTLNLLFVDDDADKGAGGDDKKDKEDDLSVDDAVDKAVKDLDKDDSSDEDKEESEDKEDSEDEDEKDEEDDLDEEQQKTAKNIFKLLNNPKTSIEALRTLAAQAGLKLSEIENKKDETAAKKTIKDIVKDKIGSKYSFLAEDLGDLLEDLFNTQVTEKTKDIRTKLDAADHQALVDKITAAQDKIIGEYVEVPNQVLKEFVRMQEAGEIMPGKNQPPDKFIRAGIREAAENLKISLVKKSSSRSESTNTKKRSPLDELSSKSRNSAESSKDGVKSTQVKNINDAISQAVEQVSKQMKKG
jgi:hypothetical protein